MTQEPIEATSKIAIVGASGVGSTLAYALLLSGLVSDIVLVNPDLEQARAEAADLNHAGPFTPAGRARAGDISDTKGAFLTVLTAETSNSFGETSLSTENTFAQQETTSVSAIEEIVPRIVANNPGGILLVASHPVELLTRLVLEVSGLPSGRVLGVGTILDSGWLTFFLSERFGVDERSIEALVLGEHGMHALPVWSACRVGAMPVEAFAEANDLPFDNTELSSLFSDTINVKREVSRQQGTSYYGMATAMLKIIEAIVRDASAILPIVTRPDEETAAFYNSGDVAISLPCVVNRQGVRRVLRMPLAEQETQMLSATAERLERQWPIFANSHTSPLLNGTAHFH